MRNFFTHIILFVALTLGHFSIFAQEPDSLNSEDVELVIKDRLEYLLEVFEDEEIDVSVIIDELRFLYTHPINLNTAKREDLNNLYLLDDFQITELLKYIAENGKLLSIYELQAIPNFDQKTIDLIRPFVEVKDRTENPPITFKNLFQEGRNEVYLRYIRTIEEKEGYSEIEDSLLEENPNKRYLGSPDQLYTRYSYRYRNNLRWGFTAEKDPGEQFFNGDNPNGFDYLSAHLYLANIGNIKAIALGDYHVQFGQGLTLWTGFNFGKSAYVMNTQRNRQGIRPYTSLDENRFLRGAAANLQFGKIEFTAFGSYKGVDANVVSTAGDSLETDEQLIVSSLQTSGQHRLPREISGKDAIQEMIVGGNVQFNTDKFHIGATGAYHNLDGTLERNLSFYNQFDFNRSELLNLGVDYNWFLGNVNIFGETSTSDNGGWATVNGATVQLDPRFAMSVYYRNFSKDYQTLYNSAFAESSRSVNEEGLYAGFELKLTPSLTLTGYFDRFQFDWLRFRADGISDGFDYLGQLTYRPSSKLEIYGRFRYRTRPRNESNDDGSIREVLNAEQSNTRVHFKYVVSNTITIRSRVEYVTYNFDSELDKGVLIYQDFIYKPQNLPLSFNLRYALFETDSWDSRVYAFENDMLYVVQIPAHNGRGSRFYFNMRWKINNNIDFWMKYAIWNYSDRDAIGTGLEQINGNIRQDIKGQLRFRF